MKTFPKPILTFVFAALFIILFQGSAVSGILTGTIIDNVVFNPVADVEVSVFRTDSTLAGIDTTDMNGIYTFTLAAGEYFAVFSKENYADTTISNITITPEGTTVIDLTFRFLQNCGYIAGDINNNGVFNGFDITYLVAWIKGGPPPPYTCECTPGSIWWVAMDYNGSCSFNGLDITIIMAYFPNGLFEIMPCADCPPVNPASIEKSR